MNSTLYAVLQLSVVAFVILESMVLAYVAICCKWNLMPSVTARELFLCNQHLPFGGAAIVVGNYFI
ncbi:hypothetical protein BOO25_18645 [Vibrio navarrensis]|nr:hypothetical protein [Vibrio navarrensis]